MGLGSKVGAVVGGIPGAAAGFFVDRVLGKKKSDGSDDAPALSSNNGQLDAPALAARQRAARKMSDGLRQTFATSTRGLEGAAGSGLAGPPQEELPFITTMTDRGLPDGTKTADQLAAERAERERRAREEAARREAYRNAAPDERDLINPELNKRQEELAERNRRSGSPYSREFV